jgi:hypothetical protein
MLHPSISKNALPHRDKRRGEERRGEERRGRCTFESCVEGIRSISKFVRV